MVITKALEWSRDRAGNGEWMVGLHVDCMGRTNGRRGCGSVGTSGMGMGKVKRERAKGSLSFHVSSMVFSGTRPFAMF
jgi:hypothetical protein